MIKLPSELVLKEAKPGFFFGNKDKNREYEIPNTWKDSVVIRESIEAKVGPKSKDVVEIPSTVHLRPFEASLFDTHIEQGMFNKKKIEIIHDPR